MVNGQPEIQVTPKPSLANHAEEIEIQRGASFLTHRLSAFLDVNLSWSKPANRTVSKKRLAELLDSDPKRQDGSVRIC